MHEHNKENISIAGLLKLILIGNPNVGKSVVFNHLTGQYVTVSNYPGTTVEISRGTGTVGGKKVEVVDAPGLNSLIPSSEDEKVARDLLLSEKPAQVLQIADAKNLRRTLLLTIELIEAKSPLTLVLNLLDELEQRRMTVDLPKLSELISLPVLGSVAVEGIGVAEIKKSALSGRTSNFQVDYGQLIEDAVNRMTALLPKDLAAARAVSLMFLANDQTLTEWFRRIFGETVFSRAKTIRDNLQAAFSRPISQVISQIRQRKADQLVSEVLTTETAGTWFLQRLGNWAMKPLFGFPMLALILYIMYKFVGEFAAGTGVDFMEEIIFGHFLNPWVIKAVDSFIGWQLLKEFLVGEYGVVTMALTYALAIVLPIVSAFFIFFGLLEDSGYLPRLAILLNKSFRLIGLSGKAIIPLVLGLGCDTMATMTTRTLESKRERIIATLLLALAIPCSAQLGVILGMVGGLSAQATMIWAGTVIFIFLLVGWLAAQVLPGKSSDFILEIPPLRLPKFSNILVKTLARLEWYVKEAVPLFILGTIILFVSDKIGLLKVIETLASPLVVTFLGLPAKATEAFLIGFLRRDYGAAGLYALAKQGLLNPNQIVVSLVTITLFVPCIAQFMVMIKERGLKVTLWITAFIFPFAFLVGGVLNWALIYFRVIL